MKSKKTVLFTRYSSEMQRPESCEDQERNIRRDLPAKGVDPTGAIVLEDRAESGTLIDRPAMQRLLGMIDRCEIGVLAVDDQGRFSRADNVFQIITDLVYSGGRFISTGEGIDTDESGWELKVKVLELHHSTTIRELGRRVRRGQEGRVLDGNGSAGDYGFGYRAVFADPAHTAWTGRGPKPKKVVVIYEPEAEVVRMVFAWFVGGMSIGAIQRKLDDLGIEKGPRSWRPGWHHQLVRRMLGNRKYIGDWAWGQTTTRRNSRGKKKQVPVDESAVVRRDRPDLRIIDDETWNKAQELIEKLHKTYGKKIGQKSRAARVHHTEIYPAGLLNGLIYCGECGGRLTVQQSGSYRYLGCRNHRTGACGVAARVRVDRAEKLMLNFLDGIIRPLPDWMETAIDVMRHTIQEAASAVPRSLAADEKRLKQIGSSIDNLVDAIQGSTERSQAIGERVMKLELEAEKIEKRIAEQRRLLRQPVVMPDDAWIQRKLADQVSLLAEDTPKAAMVLREILGKVSAHEIKIRGKKRGYIQLRFRVDALEAMIGALDSHIKSDVLKTLFSNASRGSARSPEFTIDLGEPTRMDTLAPQIAELREKRVPWKEISRITGLSLGNAFAAWKRWMDDGDDDAAAA